jgi:DNA-directed RNA polymerase subunit RPC12/RpoP
MSISLICECGKKIRVKDDLAGKRIKCPGCGKSMLVPPEEQFEESENVSEVPSEKAVAEEPKSKGKWNAWVIALAGTVILVGGAVGVYFLFLRDGAPTQPIPLTKKGTPMITANPNPVPAGPEKFGKTTITWDTGDGSIGQVYVSVNAGEERRFAGGRSKGSLDAAWIGKGQHDFRLYAGKEHKTLLASVTVTRSK